MLKAKLDAEGIAYNVIDVDEQAVLASSYNVRGVPTCIYLQDGFEKERFVGADSFKNIIELNNQL
jgi:thioredoxin-like negative regulator of GroEL